MGRLARASKNQRQMQLLFALVCLVGANNCSFIAKGRICCWVGGETRHFQCYQLEGKWGADPLYESVCASLLILFLIHNLGQIACMQAKKVLLVVANEGEDNVAVI